MRRKRHDTNEVGFTTSGTTRRLTPIDIQQKEFRLAFRGYNERDVDEFLDLVTEELAAREEGGSLSNFAGQATAGDPTDAVRDAEEIRARARAEAKDIVRDAEAQAAAILASTGPGSADERAVLAPYLNRERDFLQSLGQLVQEHAEGVRRMVRMAAERTKSQVIRIEAAEPLQPDEQGAGPDQGEPVSNSSPSEPSSERQGSVRELFWGEE
jgi:DivIVA domain-containing protein